VIALLSFALVVAGVAVAEKPLHGHVGVATVNVQVRVELMTLPARSVAPETVAVYLVPATRPELGTNFTVRVAASYDVVPATAPVGPAKVIVIVDACTASLNVALGVTLGLAPVAPSAGLVPVTVGAVVSGGGAVVSKTTSAQ
jgi:hypothetical protein